MVFQHFALFDSITVVETWHWRCRGKFDLRPGGRALHGSQRYGLPLNPWRAVHELSVGERQRVEIVRCLLQSPQAADHGRATSVLTPQAVDQLFETLRTLSAEGTAII